MKIIFLTKVDSTQTYLKNLIKENGFFEPTAIVSTSQTNGFGSRNNIWTGKNGNLFFSFVLSRSSLPNDLKPESASIYFSFLLKVILNRLGSKVWLKWPNDFYIDEKKIGGTITSLTQDLVFCGIGLNLYKVSNSYGVLDIEIDTNNILNLYFEIVMRSIPWKWIFSNFQIEFELSKKFTTTIDEKKVKLSDAVLLEDGSLIINNKKVYSLR